MSNKDMSFEIGDLVMEQLRKEGYPRGAYNNLIVKKIGPCQIYKKIGYN
jgi:hypothetical protein